MAGSELADRGLCETLRMLPWRRQNYMPQTLQMCLFLLSRAPHKT